MKVYNRNTLCDENEDEQIIIAPACKFLPLRGGIKIWACHLRCQILYKAPTQSQAGNRLTRLYISAPSLHLPPTTLKYVLKTVLFVQTHLNPSQVPCFASVWQVLGFLTCEAPPRLRQRCKRWQFLDALAYLKRQSPNLRIYQSTRQSLISVIHVNYSRQSIIR